MRNDVNQADIKKVDMPDEMRDFALKAAAQALDRHKEDWEVGAYVRERFDEKFKPAWHCIVGRSFGGCSTFSCLGASQTRVSAGFQQLEHEAAWCSTFSCLKTSETGDSAGFQVSLSQNQIDLQMSVFIEISPIWVQVELRLTETRGLRLPDEPQDRRNRSWAVEEFSATL
ncbi:Dynein light chain Tctex-type [Clonorchis sinensis]|uniref:Dynein light chain n=1 Tax=Clonorchis sinensis TaxID=79923 RepID=A0A3R7CX34_CLOSI|nr:Dynein light chain Tctex-type [Clonorchis sinensis]